MAKREKKERERDWMQVAHAVPVQFSSSVKMYSVKDVSAKVNSTHHGTIYTVG
jgi:gamma-glutamyl-gamma-aminobutyrate hydrolase PuuD